MKFLESFSKDAEKMDGVNLGMVDPEFWLDYGNFLINKIMSGRYRDGIPQGRIVGLAGASGSGKSFVASNVVKCALEAGIGVFFIDTENAIDKGYFEAIGIDPEHPLLRYADCNTLASCTKLVSKFVKAYRGANETHPFLIVIDSLDMLQTESDAENYAKKGEIGGDQGQWAKQCKKMLATFVSDIKRVNIAMLCTKQVYVNQDQYTKFEEPLKFTDGIKFAFSQICTISRARLKDEDKKDEAAKKGEGVSTKFKGIHLQIYGLKTRFTEPFQKCIIDVPYSEGMDRYSGVLDVAVSLGVVKQAGAWFSFNNEKWQGKAAWAKMDSAIKEKILVELIKQEDAIVDIMPEDMVIDLGDIEAPEDTVKRRQARAAEAKAALDKALDGDTGE